MKKNLLLFALIILGITITSCEKKYTIIPPPVPSSSIHDSIEFNFNRSLQTFSFDARYGGVHTTQGGIEFSIPDSAFLDANGDTVLGLIIVDLVEILNQPDKILKNRPTTSNNEVLICGGQFRVNFKVNDNEVTLNDSSSIGIRIPTNNPDNKMLVHDGKADNTGYVDWDPVFDIFGINVGAPVETVTIGNNTSYFYSFSIDNSIRSWISCGHTFGSGISKTSITLTLPEIHNNTNTFFFVHFNEVESVMAGFYDGDNFTTSSTIPVGSNVTLSVFSEIDGDFFYSPSNTLENISIGTGYSATITLDPSTYPEILAEIQSL